MVVCLLAAGRGSRMQKLFPGTPKPLLPMRGACVIDWQLSQLPTHAKIVMSLGPQAALVQSYLSKKHPHRHIDYVVETSPSKMCQGPAMSLLPCRDFLRQPFWLLFSDTLWSEPLPHPAHNTLFIGEYGTEKPDRFCNVFFDDNGRVLSIYDKQPVVPSSHMKPFIGLAYIQDDKIFFDSLVPKNQKQTEDLQLTYGWEALAQKGLYTQALPSWRDVGTPENYQKSILST